MVAVRGEAASAAVNSVAVALDLAVNLEEDCERGRVVSQLGI